MRGTRPSTTLLRRELTTEQVTLFIGLPMNQWEREELNLYLIARSALTLSYVPVLDPFGFD